MEQGIDLSEERGWQGVALARARGCRIFAAWTLWMLGYPDQALRQSHEALSVAQKLSQPYDMCLVLYYASVLHQLRGEVSAVYERAEVAMALASEHGFVQRLAQLMPERGWALAAQGHHAEGIAQLRQALTALQTMGVKIALPRVLALLAEAYGNDGQAEAGLRLLAGMDDMGQHRYTSELHRITGELLLKQTVPDAPQAEAYFQQALAVARRQQAKSWELRATMSLARLWQHQGKRAEAYALLASIYGWFTEGFDTADLQEAKALLEE
jgi:predicted ATPase